MANRKKQIAAIQDKMVPVAEELEALIAELQEAYDNTPEGIQESERGDAMQDRIYMLQEWHDQLTEMLEEQDV